MRKAKLSLVAAIAVSAMVCLGAGCGQDSEGGQDDIPRIANHTVATLKVFDSIPSSAISAAKSALHIAYGHTSHGSQVVTGMTGLVSFRGSAYSFNSGGSGGALDLRDTPFSGASDLGNPDRASWEAATRAYLAAHPEVNVVVWSWCGQVSGSSESDIVTYLTLMSALERDYPNVTFVYMTGHLDGSGTAGNLHRRNEQIRSFCRDGNRVLFDFADIESYDPDGNEYLSRMANDECDYDSNGDGTRESNWATAWQGAHTENTDWFNCSPAHSEALNGNMKAYAFWWLLARIAGWDGR